MGDAEEDRRLDSLRAAYTILFQRYQSNTALEWQVPAIALTGQAFLIVGAIQVESVAARAVISALILAIGAATVGAMIQIEQTARLDRWLLDEYEHTLLKGDESLRLEHSMRRPQRDAAIRARVGRPVDDETLPIRLALSCSRWAAPGWMAMGIQVLVAFGGVSVAWLA